MVVAAVWAEEVEEGGEECSLLILPEKVER